MRAICVSDLDSNAADVGVSGSLRLAELRAVAERVCAPVVSFRWITALLDAYAVVDIEPFSVSPSC